MSEQSMEKLTLALWAVNLARPLNGLEGWAQAIDEQMAAAKAKGAGILVMPEYASEQWMSFAPEGLPADKEIAWMAEQAEEALRLIAPLPAKHGMALLAGSMPARRDDLPPDVPPFVNRAHLLLEDGRHVHQDKLCLTPGERDPGAWNLSTGDEVRIVEWRGLKMATLICLDSEIPALSALLAPKNLDLLLVPSMTEKHAGYWRVFGCAKARAVELMSIVAAVGCIGRTQGAAGPRMANVSGAAVFLPCEEALGHTGIAGEVPAREMTDGAGPLLVVQDLPIAEIRAKRNGAAEVWPGAWRAEHVSLIEV